MTIAWMNPAKIKFVTIHCAATPRGRDDKTATINSYDIKQWGQISYHYVIELDGTIVPNLRHDQLGAHVGKHNTGNLGICYIGGIEKDGTAADTRTDAQKASMAQLVARLKREIPGVRMLGHRDWSPDVNGNGKVDKFEWLKSCPCFDVAAWMQEAGL